MSENFKIIEGEDHPDPQRKRAPRTPQRRLWRTPMLAEAPEPSASDEASESPPTLDFEPPPVEATALAGISDDQLHDEAAAAIRCLVGECPHPPGRC